MKKLALLSTLLGLFGQPVFATDNSIEMQQDGPANQAEVMQEGSGNRVVIRQGTSLPKTSRNAGEKLDFNPRRHHKQHWQRIQQGEKQDLNIRQQGGGKLKVHSRSHNGQTSTDIKSSPIDN